VQLFQELEEGGIKENGGGGELKCDIFDTLQEHLLMPQYTPTQHNNKGEKVMPPKKRIE
jgi:hypothetical protein